MKRLLRIGMDVHSTNYTLCALEPCLGKEDTIYANIQVAPDYHNVLKFIEDLKEKIGKDDSYDIICGYEAGCLGYSLYHKLTASGIKCKILAPTTMLTTQGKMVKTDARDAEVIAQCLAYNGYSEVYVPTEEDNAIKEYIRMRDDHKLALKKLKQQICAICLRYGKHYEKTRWTGLHRSWLRAIELPELVRETLEEYLTTFNEIESKIERFDSKIEEQARKDKYKDSYSHVSYSRNRRL